MASDKKSLSKRRRAMLIVTIPFVALGCWIGWLWCFDSAPPDDTHLLLSEPAPVPDEENAFVAFVNLPTDSMLVCFEDMLTPELWFEWCVNQLAKRPTYDWDEEGDEVLVETLYDFNELREEIEAGLGEVDGLLLEIEKLVELPVWSWPPAELEASPDSPDWVGKLRRVGIILRLQLCLCALQKDVEGMLRVVRAGSRLSALQCACRPRGTLDVMVLLAVKNAFFEKLANLAVAAGANPRQLRQMQQFAESGVELRTSRAYVLRREYAMFREVMRGGEVLETLPMFGIDGPVKANRTWELLVRDIDQRMQLPLELYSEHVVDLQRLELSATERLLQTITGNKGGCELLKFPHAVFVEFDQRLFKSRSQTSLVTTSLALLRFEQERGELPDELSQLTPHYLAKTPRDVYDGQPLRYSKKRRMVYSLGETSLTRGDPPTQTCMTMMSEFSQLSSAFVKVGLIPPKNL